MRTERAARLRRGAEADSAAAGVAPNIEHVRGDHEEPAVVRVELDEAAVAALAQALLERVRLGQR